MILIREIREDILILTFNHEKEQNPFSEELQDAVRAALKDAERDDSIKAVVLYGGQGRCFSVGGDFKEIIAKSDNKEFARTLNKIIDFYQDILKFSKPCLAATENYVIGMGYQVSLCCDFIHAAENTKFLMPELKNGVGCTLGGMMLEYVVGRANMIKICYDCRSLDLADALRINMVSAVHPTPTILDKTIEHAKVLAAYPTTAFRATKRVNNKRYIDALESVRQATVDAHCEVFNSKQHLAHMKKVLE